MSNLSDSLSYLFLGSNLLRDQLLDTLINFQILEFLDLLHNEFNASISNWIFKCGHLKYLDLFENLFYGPISTIVRNLSSLIYLNLNSNQLNGSLPLSLRKLSKLKSLYVGKIPFRKVLCLKRLLPSSSNLFFPMWSQLDSSIST